MEDSGVLKEPTDNRSYPDQVGVAFNSGAMATKPSNDQVNRNTRARGSANGLDNIGVFKLIHFGDNARGLSCSSMLHLAIDQL